MKKTLVKCGYSNKCEITLCQHYKLHLYDKKEGCMEKCVFAPRDALGSCIIIGKRKRVIRIKKGGNCGSKKR